MGLWLGLKSFEFQVLKNIQADKAVLVYSVAHILRKQKFGTFCSFHRILLRFVVCLLAS